ncbi:TolC family protein [Orrella daihaiensis]|uniref:TolC family protein n=1 Tax=Orrella daihaiensis TaxID=2782176 RepID=A0ABY4AJE2_9BURK|nr:TolC family protein [Orrella daihaiensis]UOD50397.1 TolC family protein [Orrella daihaiensis]
MRLKHVALLGALVMPSVVLSQSLPEAVQIALSQYPSILAAQSRVEAADYEITRARSGHFPQVGWQGTNSVYSDVSPTPFGPNDTWIQSPTVNMNVWSGWRVQSEVERAQAIHDTRQQQQRITRDEVAFLVVEAYLNWMRLRDLVKLAEDNLAAHERLTRDVNKIAAVDQGRRIDVDQALVRTENARLSLEQRRAEYEIFAQRLRRMLLGRLPQFPAGYEQIKGRLPTTTDQALALLAPTHPVIAQQQAQIDAAEAAVRSAKSGFSPRVDLSYQRQTTQGSGQGDYITQLNVQVPIFDGGSAYGATRSAYAELDAAKQGLTEVKVTLRENLLTGWSEYLSAKQRAVLGKKQVVNAIKLVEGYDKQFRVGRRSLLDLLTIQDNLYSYQTNATNASYEERIAKAKILAILNRLALAYQSPHDQQAAMPAQPASAAPARQPASARPAAPTPVRSAEPSASSNTVTTGFGATTNISTELGQ